MQVKEKFSRPRTEDALFKKTSDMLSNLGLGHYEENFKKEFLTDQTLPTLKEAKIPVGARGGEGEEKMLEKLTVALLVTYVGLSKGWTLLLDSELSGTSDPLT
ncbi:protein translocase [Artemisia annua]|uniref:Protein translocase n=1 Tax=Artemisia annua TaxID=35608 RepID=A0A2U1L7T6_ARTAN|nr:protein translocase [Artemisia annua]